jgi:glycosyltransferase 2 family protein
MNKLKLALRIAVPVLISAGLVWLSLRKAPVGQVVDAIARSPKGPLAAYVGILLVIHLLRTVRWGVLLERLGHVGFERLNSASAIGIMLLMVLPLRMGEFARPLLIARPPKGSGPHLRRSGAMASIVVERIVDGLFMGIVGVLALQSVHGDYAARARQVSVLVSAGFFGLCVLLGLAFFLRAQAVALTRKLLGKVSPRLGGKVASMLDAFISALHLGSGWKVAWFFALTCAYWTCATLGLALVAPAFGMHLTFLQACAVLAMQVVGVMIPAGPGMVGTLQIATQVGLSFFYGAFSAGPEGVNAVAYANTVWLLQFGQQVVVGLLFMSAGHVSLHGLLGPSAAQADEAAEEAGPAA